MSYLYTAYGLTLRLPFLCPHLASAPPGASLDVIVEYGDVPRRLPTVTREAAWWQANERQFLHHPDWGGGRFLVEDGRRVAISRVEGGTEPLLVFQLVGTVLAAILRQRGRLLLHGGTVVLGSSTLTVCGGGGAGKTTTLLGLVKAGGLMLSDDFSVLDDGSRGALRVMQGVPRAHLSVDAAVRLDVNLEGLAVHPVASHKVILDKVARAEHTPPLTAIFALASHDGSDVSFDELHGLEKIAALRPCVYLSSAPCDRAGRFRLLGLIARRVPVYRVFRPAARWSLDEVVDGIVRIVEPSAISL